MTSPDPLGVIAILILVSSPVDDRVTSPPVAAFATVNSLTALPVAVIFIASLPVVSAIVGVLRDVSILTVPLIKASLNLAPEVPISIVTVPGNIDVVAVCNSSFAPNFTTLALSAPLCECPVLALNAAITESNSLFICSDLIIPPVVGRPTPFPDTTLV